MANRRSKGAARKEETVFLGDEIVEYLGNLTPSKRGGDKAKNNTKGKQSSLNLLTCWDEVAPTYIKEHTDNVVYSTRSEETELLVYVDGASYAAELSMDKELYRLRMQEVLKKEIADIKFLVSRKR